MTIFFTSDQHFFHKNVLEFENRPFNTLEEMNEGLINAWNKVVKKSDTVYVIGDFIFHKYSNWVDILDKLLGDIILVRGNHDDSKVVKRLVKEGYFKEYHEVGTYIKHNGYSMWLTHYPMEIGLRPKKYSISGHIHSNPSNLLTQINIGVDSPLNFDRPFGQPISLDELITYLDYIDPKVEEAFMRQKGLIE